MIEKQTARYFVQYSEFLSNPPFLLQLKLLTLFLIQGSQCRISMGLMYKVLLNENEVMIIPSKK